MQITFFEKKNKSNISSTKNLTFYSNPHFYWDKKKEALVHKFVRAPEWVLDLAGNFLLYFSWISKSRTKQSYSADSSF